MKNSTSTGAYVEGWAERKSYYSYSYIFRSANIGIDFEWCQVELPFVECIMVGYVALS